VNKLSSKDRSALIKLASSLPAGSSEKRSILEGLAQNPTRVASGEFNIPGKNILEGAQVTENAKVSDDAQAFGRAQVSGKAKVFGKSSVSDRAHVYGMAQVYGEALVYGNAKVTLHANVSGDARVYGNATVAGQAMITGHAKVFGKAVVMGKAKVFGRANISGTTVIYGGNWDGSEGPITSGSWEGPGIPVEGARMASINGGAQSQSAGLHKVSWMDPPSDFSNKSGENELERAERIIDEYPATKRMGLFWKIYNVDMHKYEDSGELELENDKRLFERDLVLPDMNARTSVRDVLKHEQKLLERLSKTAPKRASGNAKEIAKDIWETVIFERDLSSSDRPWDMRKIEKAVAEMLSEGAVFDDKGVKILAGSPLKEREEHYGEYEGFYDLDDALYRDGPQDY